MTARGSSSSGSPGSCFSAPSSWGTRQPAVTSIHRLPWHPLEQLDMGPPVRRLRSAFLTPSLEALLQSAAGKEPLRECLPYYPRGSCSAFQGWCFLMDDFPQHPRERICSKFHSYNTLEFPPPSTGPQPGPFSKVWVSPWGSPADGAVSLLWESYLSPEVEAT